MSTQTETQFSRALRRSRDRKSTRLNSSHDQISYAVFCLKKKKRHHLVVRGRGTIPLRPATAAARDVTDTVQSGPPHLLRDRSRHTAPRHAGSPRPCPASL